MPIILLILAAPVIIGAIAFFKWVSEESVYCSEDERRRILAMVEDGKISTEEGAELLDALGKSTAFRAQDKLSRLDIVVMVGAVIVFLGFLLPWTRIGNIGYQAGYHVGAIGWAVIIIAVMATIPIFVTPKNMLYKISMMQIFLLLLGFVLVVVLLIQTMNTSRSFCPGLFVCLAGYILMFIASVAKYKKLAA